MEAWNIRMTFGHMRIARKAGGGNMSKGVRFALERLAESYGEELMPAPPPGAGVDEPLR